MVNVGRLTTAEAAQRLGVKPQSLYAYVSRGFLRSERGPRGSTFDASEVERLAASRRRGDDASQLVFPSAVTLIDAGRLYYRGVDAIEVARSRTFEEVAEWLWRGVWPDAESVAWAAPQAVERAVVAAQKPLSAASLPIDRFRVIAAVAATLDPFRFDTSSSTAIATGRRLLRLMVSCLPAAPARRGAQARDRASSQHRLTTNERPGWLARRLWSRLTPRQPTSQRMAVLDDALVLLADHELAAATLAVRVAAAFRADPYAVVGTGLNALGGTRHGGASLAVESLLRDAATLGPAVAIEQRMRRGERLPGFGQVLYPDGDPRAPYLLHALEAARPPARSWRVVQDVLDAAAGNDIPSPNVDFALAALGFVTGMIVGAGETIFAVARTAGWIAHALEQYSDDSSFRARARYVGERPSRDMSKASPARHTSRRAPFRVPDS